MRTAGFLSLLSIILDITKLRTDLYTSFWKEDAKYQQFGTWDHMKGLFPSDIHFNFVDKTNSDGAAFMR